jgi:BASS family bile acid:Na+ symporter
MNGRAAVLDGLAHFISANFLWLLSGSYALAACFPAPGLWIRDVSAGEVSLGGATTRVSLSMVMLALLLLNAGLGVEPGKIREMLGGPKLLGVALAANLLIPIAFIFLVTRIMAGWHNADEVQNILVGLALVASMPIAGSSTAWAQNADGDLALSLGMVLVSTLLSPLTTPLALHAVGLLASGEYAWALEELAGRGTGIFLTLCVFAPALAGIAARRSIGEGRFAKVKPRLKLINSLILLGLNYSNAAVSLPQAVERPDLDFLAVTLVLVVGLCTAAFTAGWSTSRLLKATATQRTSLMFGLGMNNNGTGLVLASLALADYPRVMLPIIFYNLVQHLVAGAVDRLNSRGPTRPRPTNLRVGREGMSDQRAQAPRIASLLNLALVR